MGGATLTLRRALLLGLFGTAGLAGTASAQRPPPPPGWWENERRRRDFERWRAAEWRRRERASHRHHEHRRYDGWEEEREREAWARQQRWYR